MKRRLLKAVGAGGVSQLVTIAIQLLTVPIFLSKWTLSEYGVWLLISTIPTYLSLTDFGITSATSSRMTVLVARGAPAGANRVFQAGVLYVALLAGLILAAAPLAYMIVSLTGGGVSFSAAAAILVVGVWFSQLGGLTSGLFRSTGRNHQGITSATLCRVSEWLGGVAFLVLLTDPFWVALGMLLGRVAMQIPVSIRAVGAQSTFYLRVGRWKFLRLQFSQSVANFSTTLASSLTLQGFVLVVGSTLGPSTVTVFSVYRTLARTIVQATAIISHAAWPEFSVLFGSRKVIELRRTFYRVSVASAALSFAAAILLALMGSTVITAWTHGRVQSTALFDLLFAVYALVASLWHVPRVLLTAIGRNRDLARWVLPLSAFAVVAAAAAGTATRDLVAIIAVMIAYETSSATVAVVSARRSLKRSS